MRYSVCIIDNDLPAGGALAVESGINDTQLLNSSNLQLLVNKATWTDNVVKTLTTSLLTETNADGHTPKWDVSGFTNPAFYINNINEGLFRSDIVIFDWDYPGAPAGAGADSASLLMEILTRTFSLIFIFSGADKKDEILAVLERPDFLEFKGRIEYLDKAVDGVDQTTALLAKAEQMYGANFSFKFAGGLRKQSIRVMDKILSDLGRATVSDVKNYLAIEEAGAKRELVDFIAERFRAGLVAADFPELDTGPAAAGQPPDQALVKKMWGYRLYLPNDNTIDPATELVRRGDVIKHSGKFFLVVSADCDLRRFYHKNFGSINLLPLHRLHNDNVELRDMLTFCVAPNELKQGDFKHLTEKIGKLSEGPFVLPFLHVGDKYENFVAMPKEFTGRQIAIHADVSSLAKEKRKHAQLKYGWWDGADKICSVSEPFLSAVIQHTFGVIGGFGVPNYPNPVMKTIFQEILTEFTATPAAGGAMPAARPTAGPPSTTAPPEPTPTAAAAPSPAPSAPVSQEAAQPSETAPQTDEGRPKA